MPLRWFAWTAMLAAGCAVPAPRPTPASAETDKLPPALRPVTENPRLPNVLLIGDSISIGYTRPTREKLKGVANVHRPPTNCGPTTRGLAHLETWLGDRTWDVIHFNWGLHDLKYIDDRGKRVDPKQGTIQVPIFVYEKNLDALVARLKHSSRRLIWASTTPVPAGAHGRMADDAVRYNETAYRVMKRHGVPINDLHTFARLRLKFIQKPKDVHFTAEGSEAMAERVAHTIRAALNRLKQ